MPKDNERKGQALDGKLSFLTARVRHLKQALSPSARPAVHGEGRDVFRESEERLRFALEGLDAGMWDYRPESGEVIYDESVLRLLGYRHDTPPLDPEIWPSLLHPDDREVVGVGLEGFLKGDQEHYESLFRLRTRDGEWRWMRSHGKVVARDAEGRVTRMVGVLLDVTDRKEAEDEIAERLRFEALVSDLSAAFVNLPDEGILDEIERWLEVLAKFLKVDACIVWGSLPDQDLELLRGFKTADYPGFPDRKIVNGPTWFGDRMRAGETVILEDLPGDLPAEAVEERRRVAQRGIRAYLGFPMMMAGNLIGALTVSSMRPCRWSPGLVSRFRLIGEIFAGALQRVRTAEELRFRREFESLVASLSMRFLRLSASEIDAEIQETLARTGSFLDADRAYVYLIRDDGECFDNTHEWVREGIARRLPEMQGMAVADFAYGQRLLETGEPVIIQDALDVPPELGKHRELLDLVGVRSSASVPLTRGKGLIGLVGFALERSPRQWDSSTISMLRVIAEMIGGALERKRSEEALQFEKDRAQLYLDIADVVLMVLGADGRITMINHKGCDLLGYDESELLGKNWFGLCLPDKDREATRAVFSKLMVGEVEPVEYHENLIVTSVGEHRLVAWHNTLVRDADGRIVGTLSSGEDITERRRATEELRDSEHRFRTVVEQAGDSFYLITMEGGIADVNQQACKSVGYTRDELLTMNLAEIDLVFADRLRRGLVLQELAPGKSVTLQAVHRRKDGRIFPVELRVGLLELAGQQYLLGLCRDVSERQRMQEAIIQSEKMMTVGGLAAGMAHEINNPLSGILQGVQNALRRISPEFPANQEVAAECGIDLGAMNDYLKRREVLDFLNGIQGAGTRAARIIRNMLQFSRPGVTERTPTNLGELLDRTLDLATADFDPKKKYDFRSIRVECVFDRALSEVPCVATELEQVILNILKNAAEAMLEQEERMEPRRLTLRTLGENGWARIEIEDNGPGMDEETRRRVFEPFFTTKEVGSGTGLGLSVSYFIITNNHRGTIDVESQPGKGAKFIIRLPLR